LFIPAVTDDLAAKNLNLQERWLTMDKVQDRIRKYFNQLTNRQKIVAKFILGEPKSIALHPAKVIGAMTETSETTVIRLCYALQYSGYSELQNEIRETFLSPDKQKNPVSQYLDASNEPDSDYDPIAYTKERDIAQIEQTLNELDQQTIDKAVAAILQAKKIVVTGFRTSFAPAHWLSVALNLIKGDTYLYRGPIDDANYLISEADRDWLVIALSFPRYMQETVSFAEAAKAKGATIVALSDDALSPIGPIADLLIKVTITPSALFTGMPSIFSVLNVLISGVTAADRDRVQNRLRQYDITSERFYPFAEVD
jgi:DNA-binding MurR/RpiR family transcriptional regulator